MEDLSPHDQVIIDKILNMEEESQEALITSPQQQQFKTEGAGSLQLCGETQTVNNNAQILNNTATCSTTSGTATSLEIQNTNRGLPKDLRHLEMDGFSDLVNDQENKPSVSEGTVSFVYCTPSNQPQHVYTSPSISPVQRSQGDSALCNNTNSPSNSTQSSLQTLLEQQKQIQNHLHIISQRKSSDTPLLSFVNSSQSDVDFKTPLTVTTDSEQNISNALTINQTPNLSVSDSEQNMESDTSILPSQNDKSMLHHLLTSPDGYLTGSTDFNNASSPETASSPDYHPADSPSSLSSPASIVQHDPNTQSTLIVNAGRLHLDSESGNEEISFHGLWQEAMQGDEDQNKQTPIDTEKSPLIVAPAVDKVFDPECVDNSFTFTMFGSDQQAFLGIENRKADTATGGVKTLTEGFASMDDNKERIEMPPPKSIPTTRSQTHSKRVKEPSLNQHFPWKVHGYELRILDQPEEQHRARYLTEGSRGAVKNRSQEGHPVVKLFGPAESSVLQVFIGNDSGKVKPHGFYQACKVCGKNSTPARERDIDGTTVIEMDLTSVSDMSASVDNVGILKLRNADVEQRIGLTKAKKKSVKARMIFRAVFRKADGNMQTLQIASNSILCTQPIGQPEVCKMSRSDCSATGKGELFLIGKNFMKGTKVFFQEVKGDDNEIVWEKEAEIDKDYFQPTHLICSIPPYKDTSITSPVSIQILVQSCGKMSDPHSFSYLPDIGKQDTPMETQETSQKRKLSFTVSPEALELNQQIQHTSGMFQLPPGTLSTANITGVTNMQVDSVVSVSASVDRDNKPVSPILDTKPIFSLDNPEADNKPMNVISSISYDTKPIHLTGIGGIPTIVPSTSMEQAGLTVGQNFQQTTVQRCTSPIKQTSSCSAALLQAVEEMKSLQRSTAGQQSLEQDQLQHRQPGNPDLQQQYIGQAVEMTGVQEALLNHLTAGKYSQQHDIQLLPQQQPMVVSSLPQLPILREHLTTDINQQNVGSTGVKTEIPMAVISPSSITATKGTISGTFTSLHAATSTATVQSPMSTQQIMATGIPSPMATILPSSLAFPQFTQAQQIVSPPKDIKPAASMTTSVPIMSNNGTFASPVSGPQQVGMPQIIICGGAGQSNNLNGLITPPQPQIVQPQPPPAQQPPAPQQPPTPQQPTAPQQPPAPIPQQPPIQQPMQQLPPPQQPAPLGPSIFILPGGGGGGANTQVENLLRSILGSLQPAQQPQS